MDATITVTDWQLSMEYYNYLLIWTKFVLFLGDFLHGSVSVSGSFRRLLVLVMTM